MTFLATDETQERQTAQQLAAGPGVVPFGGPATFEGFGSAAGVGVGRGLSATGGVLFEFGQKVDPFRGLREYTLDIAGLSDEYKKAQDDISAAITGAVEYYRPDPETTGAAGNLAFGVTSTLTPAVVGTAVGGPWAGAAAAGGATGFGTYTDMIDEGVDPETARGTAAIEGVLIGAGVLLPAGWGARAITRIGTGAAANVAIGGVERAAMGTYLDEKGYGEIAERYRVMDGQAIAIDTILGAAFGALPAGKPADVARPGTDEIDAALTLNSSKNAEIDVAPGIPADAASRVAHIRAVDTSVQQLLRGEPVNVGEFVREANFVEKPPLAGDDALLSALRDSGYPELADQVKGLEDALAARGRAVDEPALPEVPARAPQEVRQRDSGEPVDQAAAAVAARPEMSIPRTIAYHGTPHAVDRFSLEKVGSGEGNQAFGWGLYFASQKEVAESYRDSLSGVTLDGVPVNNNALGGSDSSVLAMFRNRLAAKLSIEDARQQTARWAKGDKFISEYRTPEQIDSFVNRLDVGGGNVYQVDVPGHSRLIDYDKPLRDQSAEVIAALEPYIADAAARRKAGATHRMNSHEARASVMRDLAKDAYADLSQQKGDQQSASEYLQSLGIPGMRYLDAASRDKGDGSHNYVIWDEDAISAPTAADAIKAADEAVSDAKSDGAAFQAAVNCFLRSGG